MATHAQTASTDTKERLVRVASREFATRGYDGASLRQICSAAGVTTGALYFFFKNKEDLFRTVVSPVVEPLRNLLADVDTLCAAGLLSPGDALSASALPVPARDFLALCYERRNVVRIMTRNRECSVMEGILDETVEVLAASVRERLERSGSTSELWDEFVVYWLADVALSSVTGILEADDTLEDACRHMGLVLRFVAAGVLELAGPEGAAPRRS